MRGGEGEEKGKEEGGGDEDGEEGHGEKGENREQSEKGKGGKDRGKEEKVSGVLPCFSVALHTGRAGE